jgi:hypothetical protein
MPFDRMPSGLLHAVAVSASSGSRVAACSVQFACAASNDAARTVAGVCRIHAERRQRARRFAGASNTLLAGSTNSITLPVDGDFAPPGTIFVSGFESIR